MTAADEYEKRLGEQDYWDYTTVSTPNGNGSIEHSKGNFTYSQQDASLPSAELSFDIVRNYNSQSTVKTAFGLGWDHSLNLELLRLCDPESGEENGYVFKDGSGSIFQFKKQEDGSYAIPGSKEYRLTELLQDEMVSVGGEEQKEESNGQDAGAGEESAGIEAEEEDDELSGPQIAYRFLMKDKENQSYYFNSGGQLVYVTEPNGTWQTFAYDENQGLLTKITNNADRELTFTYQDGEGEDHLLVKAITLPDKSSIQYTYEDEHLKKATRKAGDSDASVTYAYEYTKDGKVSTVLDAENNAYTVGYASEKADSVTYPNGDKLTLSYQDGKTVVKKLAAGGGELYTESVEYDKGSGNPVRTTDALGNQTSYVYENNLLMETSKAVDYQVLEGKTVVNRKKTLTETNTYDENGNPLKEKEEDGSVTTYEYGASGEVNASNPTKIVETDGDGKVTSNQTLTYDEKGNEISSRDSVSSTATNSQYEGSSADEAGHTEKEATELNGNVTTESETVYDEDGNELEDIETTGEITETTANEYDAMGNQIRTMASEGTVTETTYDFLGRQVQVVTDFNGIKETETTTYYPNGQVKTETAADGTATSYTYDNMNRLLTTTIAKDGKTETTANSYTYGSVTIYTGTDGSTQTIPTAEIEKSTNASGDIVSVSYSDGKGQKVREKVNGLYTDYVYDNQGRTIATYVIGTKEDAPENGKLTVAVYDENGNQAATLINPVTAGGSYQADENTIVTTQTFDARGNVLTSTDGEGNTTVYEYDEGSRIARVKLDDKSGENVTSYQYDKTAEDGSITSTTVNALGKISETTEDASGRVKSIVDHGDGDNAITTNHQYDADGNQSKTIYANGDYKTYSYDGKNRLTAVAYFRQSGEKTLVTEYEYNKSDQITAMKDYRVEGEEEIPYRYTGYEYDAFDRLAGFYEVNDTNKPSAEEIAAAKISYTYDTNGNRTSLSYPEDSGEVAKLSYHYNSDNWLTSITAVLNNGTENKLREYTYHTDGKVKSMKDYREFVSGGESYILRSYEYDSFDRVTRMAYTDSRDLNEVLESHEYTYDKNHNILTEKSLNRYPLKDEEKVNETRAYTYDNLGRLTKSVIEKDGQAKKTVQYSYDKVGNRLTMEDGEERTEYTYNGLNQLTTSATMNLSGSTENKVSDKIYQYDANGNQIREADSVTGEERQNTFDVENRLSQAVIKKGDVVSVDQRNEYNGEGQRIRKCDNGKVTDYFYEGASVLYTANDTGDKTGIHYMGLTGNVIAAQKRNEEGEFAAYLYNKNVQGSTTGLIASDGMNALSYRYDEFGNTEVLGDATVENEICYTGGIYDAAAGEYYLNARYYDPEDGRFVTQDTYRGEPEKYNTWNLYCYCANSPVTYVDPSGHIFEPGLIFGFKYDSKQKIFFSGRDCWQRNFGYCNFYDKAASYFGMYLTTKKIQFSYGKTKWRFQLWKGRYGLFTGGEIGIYAMPKKYCRGFYMTAHKFQMKMSLQCYLKKGDKKLFSRRYQRHWWLNGFKKTKKKYYGRDLTLRSTLLFPNKKMKRKFMRAFHKGNGGGTIYSVSKLEVRIIW